jgi:hypothetical protein
MSFSGKSPSAKRIRYTPQSVDPVNPTEGDFFYSDGTPRIAGPWVYQGGSWQQVQTSGALSTVNDLTFLPNPTPVVGPSDEGMVFYSDGSDRAEGLWLYNGTDWTQLSGVKYQEFSMKDFQQVTLATSVADGNIGNINTRLRNGQSIDGTVLVTGDLVLLKSQATQSDNGVYTVLAAADPGTVSRSSIADDATKLSYFSAAILKGTQNANTQWFQTESLASLATNQTWSATPASFSFTVPGGVYELNVIGVGGGGSGGGGGGALLIGAGVNGGGGGSGGSGAVPQYFSIPVQPADILTIQLGKGGTRVNGGAGGDGSDGVSATLRTTITHGSKVYSMAGGIGGNGGVVAPAANGGYGAGGARTGNSSSPSVGGQFSAYGGKGCTGNTNNGESGETGIAADGGIEGSTTRGGGGGGGGASLANGGIGGNGNTGSYTPILVSPSRGVDGNKGSGGGGGGGFGNASGGGPRTGASSGNGGPGYVRISW